MDVLDVETNKKRRLWIENGKVRYSEINSEHSGMYLLNTDQFEIVPGKVTLDHNISQAYLDGTGTSYVKRLLLFGFTSFVNVIEIDHERSFTDALMKSRNSLLTCPLDYVHAIRLPLSRLTDSWMRKIKLESIPIIFFSTDSLNQLEGMPWKRLLEGMFPKRILLVCEASPTVKGQSERQEIHQAWKQIVQENRMNSFFHFPPSGQAISPLLAKRIGLFPKKGVLVMGSDADYTMYERYPWEEQPIKLPDVIALKGHIVKAGKQWNLDQIEGEELTSIVPEQFLPIQDVYRYED